MTWNGSRRRLKITVFFEFLSIILFSGVNTQQTRSSAKFELERVCTHTHTHTSKSFMTSFFRENCTYFRHSQAFFPPAFFSSSTQENVLQSRVFQVSRSILLVLSGARLHFSCFFFQLYCYTNQLSSHFYMIFIAQNCNFYGYLMWILAYRFAQWNLRGFSPFELLFARRVKRWCSSWSWKFGVYIIHVEFTTCLSMERVCWLFATEIFL